MTAPEPTLATAASPRPRMSRGEKIFDTFVYGPMNMIGTFLLTIPVAWSMEHGLGRKPFNATKNFLMTRLNFSESLTKSVLTTTVLMMGGNLMVAPVRWAERRKEDIVSWLNGTLRDAADTPVALHGPQQSWGSLIKARLVAWAVVFGAFFGVGKLAGGEKIHQIETSFADKVCAKFGWAKEEMAMVDGVMTARPTRAYGYSKIAALDVFATAAAGILLYAGSRFFAKRKEAKEAEPLALEPVPAPTQTVAPAAHHTMHTDVPETTLLAERSVAGQVSEASAHHQAHTH